MKKEAIIAYFKKKYPALNLRKKRLDEISARLEDKVKDESELEAKLDDLDAVYPFADIAKDDDAKYEAERKLKELGQKTTPPKTPDEPDPEPKPGSEKSDEKDIAKIVAAAVAQAVGPLQQEIAGLKGDTHKQKLNSKLIEGLEGKKIPKSFYETAIEGRELAEDAQVDDLITKIEAGYTKFSSESLGNVGPVIIGNGSTKKEFSKEDTDAIVNSII